MNKSLREQLEIAESVPMEIMVDPLAIQEAFMEEDSYKARVRLIKSCVSKNGNWYTENVLQEAAPLFDGVPSFVDHKELKDRSAKDKVGDFNEAAFEDGGVLANFHVYPGTGKWLWENMKAAPHSVQLSIKARGLSEKVKHPETGQDVNKIRKLTAVESVDVVAVAAAGGGVVGLLKESAEEVQENMDNLSLDALKSVERLREEAKGEVVRETELNRLRDEIKAYGEFKETLKAAGFDSVTAVLDKLAESLVESKSLREKIGQYELEKRIAEKEATVQKLVKESELKPEYIDESFMESLRTLSDEAAMKEAIASRLKLIHAVEAKVRGNGPEPAKPETKPDAALPTDDEIIARLKR